MNTFLKNITPDSLSGIIFALEGVKRSLVILNGPTGCKFYNAATSDSQVIRQREFDPLNFPPVWYFGQPRVPCTYLDNADYVYGSEEKLTEVLEYMRDNVSFDVVAIVNSPGASLIGDDIRGIAESVLGKGKPLVTLETPGFSSDVCHGHETACLELLKQVPPKTGQSVIPKTVNILGLSLFQKNYMGDVLEIKRLMELCGIEVNCFLCGSGSMDEVSKIPSAALNVVIHPEYGMQTADYLERTYGTPYYVCPGPPIGYKATEKMMLDLCNALGCNSAAFLEDSERKRARSYVFVSRVNSFTGMPKAVPYSIEGTCSELYAYIGFLTGYFGMVPVCASVLSEQSSVFHDKLVEMLGNLGFPHALERDILDTKADLVFGSGNTIAALKLKGMRFSGIETSLPTIGYYNVVPKTYLGTNGALLLTELVLNGLMY